MEEIAGLLPDLICLSEAWGQSLESFGGHLLDAKGVSWSAQDADERKVLLWSSAPWTDVDQMEAASEFGGAISGCTQIRDLIVRVVGVCIPYHMASPFGQAPAMPPWEQHERFLQALAPYLCRWRQEGPVIVMGDFNRKIPRAKRTPRRSFEMLEDAFREYQIATEGTIEPLGAQTIDHVAFAGTFDVARVEGRSAVSPDGMVRSDHFGVVVDFELSA